MKITLKVLFIFIFLASFVVNSAYSYSNVANKASGMHHITDGKNTNCNMEESCNNNHQNNTSYCKLDCLSIINLLSLNAYEYSSNKIKQNLLFTNTYFVMHHPQFTIKPPVIVYFA